MIAVDGPAGAGKSTVARRLASRLGGVRLDTGAIYRALALVAMERGVSLEDGAALGELAAGLDLRFAPVAGGDGGQRVLLGARDVTLDIRTPEVTLGASQVSQHAQVRASLLSLQRELGARGLVVAEGRDMGTVVFPGAVVKFYLTASDEVRARRRHEELLAAGKAQTFEEVLRDQRRRDEVDMRREESPLRQAPDAQVIDSTSLDIDQVVEHMAAVVRSALFEGNEMTEPVGSDSEQRSTSGDVCDLSGRKPEGEVRGDHDQQPEGGALARELRELEAELADREAALPAHSIRPHQLLEIEDLEERIADLKRRIGGQRGEG